MPTISKVRFANVVYDNGQKRYVDSVLQFDGHNGIMLLQNGAGKTVFVQTLIQAVLPHASVAHRKIQDTLMLNNNIAHIAVEWILQEQPRIYGLTAVSLFKNSRDELASQKFAMEYPADSRVDIDTLPLIRNDAGKKRAATKEEMAEYFRSLADRNMNAKFFSENDTIANYQAYLEEHFKIIAGEWQKIVDINSDEGGVEAFFAGCRTSRDLVDRLLLPTVESGLNSGREQDNGFADTFLQQREHFKAQKQQKSRIEEIEKTLEALEQYNGLLGREHQVRLELSEENAKLKTIYKQVERVRKTLQEDIDHGKRRREELSEALEANKKALAGWKVLDEGEKRQQAQEKADLALEKHQQVRAEMSAAQNKFYSLQLAQYRRDAALARELQAEKQKQLSSLDANPQLQELQQSLQDNAGRLHYVLHQEEARLEDQMAEEAAAQSRLRQERLALEEQQHRLDKALTEKNKEIAGVEAAIRIAQEEKERIEAELFPDAASRSVSEQIRIWQRGLRESQQKQQEAEKNIAFYTGERDNILSALPGKKEKLEELRQEQQALALDKKEIDSRGEELLVLLQQQPKCANMVQEVAGLYQRREYFLGQLGDERELARARQQALDLEWRRARRELDLYEGQESFQADELLVRKLEEWSRDFTYLKSGSEVFQQLSQGDKARMESLYEGFPYWAVTLVTSAGEKPRLMDRLDKIAGQLSAPVLVITDQEVRSLQEGDALQDSLDWVQPGFWQSVMPDYFAQWLEQLHVKADQVESQSQENQQILKSLEGVLQRLQEFLAQHPHSEYREICDGLANLERSIAGLQQEIQRAEENLAQCRSSIEKYQQNKLAALESQRDLEFKLKRCDEYQAKDRQHKDCLKKLEKLQPVLRELEQQLQEARAEMQRLAAGLEKSIVRRAGLEAEKRNLQQRPFYKEAMAAEPVADERSYETLAAVHQSWKNKLEGFDENRGRLEAELQQAERDFARLNKEMGNLQRQHKEIVFVQDMEFPADGEQLLESCWQEAAIREAETRSTEQGWRQADKDYQRADSLYQRDYEEYMAQYDALPEFSEPLAEAAKRLKDEKRGLFNEHKALLAHIDVSEQRARRGTELIHELDGRSSRLGFLAEEQPEAILTAQWDTEDLQLLESEAAPIVTRALEVLARVENLHVDSDRGKDKLVRHCETRLAEDKMRRRMVDGVNAKKTYAEFCQWRDQMVKWLEHNKKLSEDACQQAMANIETMISHMVKHLEELCLGLKDIADKTRVKTASGTREIINIHLPEWQSGQASQAVRKYLEIVEMRLEDDRYRDDAGREDGEKIQKGLQKMLRSEQVLKEILGENKITVKCRKATADNDFSQRLSSWEDSNKWSGGEVWSKNMALFLGCLSYLAERRCHIRQGRHNTRVVVADNPFGKASSDHVLSPVFFVAQQLGFQIIALTAHEDGNFIRKYFPVIYSFGFKALASGKGRVLEAEKELSMAFFKDSSPEIQRSLERMTENEQMSLF